MYIINICFKMYNYYIKVTLKILFINTIIVKYVSTTAIKQNDPYDSYIIDEGLYDANDSVIVLNVTTLKSSIYESKKAWTVEFYNSWCGHCRRFAPVWKSLANGIVGWKDIIEVAAINCANDDNNPICREYKVMYYPTIRYFSPNTKPDSLGNDVDQGDTEEAMRHNIIKHLQKDQISGIGLSWPNLAPYRSSELQDIWAGVPEAIQYKFYFFEDNSFIGTEIILDLHNITTIQIRRVTSDNQWLCMMFKVTNFPALFGFDRDSTQTSLKISVPTRIGVLDEIKKFLKSKGLVIDSKPVNTSPIQVKGEISKENKTYNSFKLNGDHLYQSDLESALRYSLEQEIPLIKTIDNVKLESLKQYLRVLALYFPLKHSNSAYLPRIRDIIENKTSIDGKDFRELVKLTEQKLSPVYTSKQQWVGCRSSSTSTLRGYPCGVWMMWHTLTVNYAIENGKSMSVDKSKWILTTMHGYIKNFFGCSDCAEHFISMAEELKLFDIDNADDAVLWLWKAHNQVNSRLAGDFTEDPEFPKIQYPSKENCQKCRNDDDSWNQVQVLDYLKKKYSYSSIQYNNSNILQLRFDKNEFIREKNMTDQQRIGWDFTIFDISICVIIYVISATMLVLVCIKFVVKRSSKKKLQIPNLLGRV
ncbi:sulfhydryl oxidase 2 [Microplitis demolitor]|uniref:sulfhydryl oxidase 2 n=1 Tax=Microplitis demolitor TaxID=69319 RepID=UPI00235B6C89|nr:sulfhydryl oxidase 2 [Microplitis demolitor]